MSLGRISILSASSAFSGSLPFLPSMSRSFRPQRGGHCFLSFSSSSRPSVRKCVIVNSSGGTVQPPPPPPSSGASSSSPDGLGRKGWIAGIVVTFLLPFLTSKLGPLLIYKKELDTVIETVEETAEVVEKVAEEVDKLAELAEEELPDGQFKNAATLVEQMAEEVAKDAHLVDAAFHKVQELEENAEKYLDSSSTKTSKTNNEGDINNQQA